jgi:trigger factor
MQVTETLSEGLKRGFTVVVPGEDIESRRTARLTDLGKTLRLPGFRPGKVPLPIVRQRYGTAVTAEVLEESVSKATEQVLTERNMRPAQTPKIDVVSGVEPSAGAAKDLEFKVEFELLPDIVLPDFGQISLTRRKAEVPADVVDKALADLATRNRELVEIAPEELAARTEHPGAATGEVLTVDFVGKIDGTPFPNGASNDVDVELGGGSFIPGFADQLEGLRPGDSRTISVTFPEEYANKDLAGKAATFDVTAKKLSRPVVPAVDDELAKKLAFDDLAGLRRVMSERYQRDFDAMSRVRLKRELLDALAEHVNFEAPQGMVDQEFEQIWQRLEAERKEGRLDEDDKDKDEAALRADYRAIAERRVKLGLVLAEIGRVNGIVVAPEELTRAMRAEAARYPGQEAQMMEFFRKYPQAENALRGPIFEDKVIDFVLELAKVTDQTVTPEELAQEPPIPPPSGTAARETAAETDTGRGGAGSAAPVAEATAPTESAAPTDSTAATEAAASTAEAAAPATEAAQDNPG